MSSPAALGRREGRVGWRVDRRLVRGLHRSRAFCWLFSRGSRFRLEARMRTKECVSGGWSGCVERGERRRGVVVGSEAGPLSGALFSLARGRTARLAPADGRGAGSSLLRPLACSQPAPRLPLALLHSSGPCLPHSAPSRPPGESRPPSRPA